MLTTGTSVASSVLYLSWQNLLRTSTVWRLMPKGDGHFMADCYLNRAIKGAKVKTEILDEKGRWWHRTWLMPETAMRRMSTSRQKHLSSGLPRLRISILPSSHSGCSRQDAPQRTSEFRLPHHRIPCQRWRLYQWSESYLQKA